MSETKRDSFLFFLSKLLKTEITEKNLPIFAKKYRKNTLDLWEGFTRHKKLVSSYLEDSDFMIAYLLGFHGANTQRMQSLLSRLDNRSSLLKNLEKISVWDFGCGLGAMTLSLLEYFKDNNKEIKNLNFFDTSPLALSLIENFLDHQERENFQFKTGNFLDHLPEVSNLSPEKTNIFIFGYVLNELGTDDLKKVSSWLKTLNEAPPSLVLIIDSGDESHCSLFMNLRDTLVKDGLHALYPCPHDKKCPLQKNKDRCYSETHWDRPKAQIIVDDILKHPRRVIASSSYAFANQSLFNKRDLSLPRVEKVLVGLPKDSRNPEKLIPIYCNKRGQFDKRGQVFQKTFTLLRGEIPQLKKNSNNF